MSSAPPHRPRTLFDTLTTLLDKERTCWNVLLPISMRGTRIIAPPSIKVDRRLKVNPCRKKIEQAYHTALEKLVVPIAPYAAPGYVSPVARQLRSSLLL